MEILLGIFVAWVLLRALFARPKLVLICHGCGALTPVGQRTCAGCGGTLEVVTRPPPWITPPSIGADRTTDAKAVRERPVEDSVDAPPATVPEALRRGQRFKTLRLGSGSARIDERRRRFRLIRGGRGHPGG